MRLGKRRDKTITMWARYSHLSPAHRLSVVERIALSSKYPLLRGKASADSKLWLARAHSQPASAFAGREFLFLIHSEQDVINQVVAVRLR
jgi:hypothetical protein